MSRCATKVCGCAVAYRCAASEHALTQWLDGWDCNGRRRVCPVPPLDTQLSKESAWHVQHKPIGSVGPARLDRTVVDPPHLLLL